MKAASAEFAAVTFPTSPQQERKIIRIAKVLAREIIPKDGHVLHCRHK